MIRRATNHVNSLLRGVSSLHSSNSTHPRRRGPLSLEPRRTVQSPQSRHRLRGNPRPSLHGSAAMPRSHHVRKRNRSQSFSAHALHTPPCNWLILKANHSDPSWAPRLPRRRRAFPSGPRAGPSGARRLVADGLRHPRKARCCNDARLRALREAQPMIGESAAAMRADCSGVIIPFSNSPKRGICTPDRMYCQRYAASTVDSTDATSAAVMDRPQIWTK